MAHGTLIGKESVPGDATSCTLGLTLIDLVIVLISEISESYAWVSKRCNGRQVCSGVPVKGRVPLHETPDKPVGPGRHQGDLQVVTVTLSKGVREGR